MKTFTRFFTFCAALLLMLAFSFSAVAQNTYTFPGGSLNGSFGAWGGKGHFYPHTFNVNAPGGIDITFYDIDVSQTTEDNVWSTKGVAIPGVSASNLMTSIDPANNSVFCIIYNLERASGQDYNGQAITTLGPDGICGTNDDTRQCGTQDWYRQKTGGKIAGPADAPHYNPESYETPNPRHQYLLPGLPWNDPTVPVQNFSASDLNKYDFRLRILPTGHEQYTYEMWFRKQMSAAEIEGAYWDYNIALNNTHRHSYPDAWRKFTYGVTDVVPITGIDLSSVYVFMGLGNFEDPASHTITWGQIEVKGTYVNPPAEVWVDDDYTIGGTNDGHDWGYDAFATIQDGINAVTASGIVHVAAGTYNEEVTVNKSVTLEGAQYGVDPRPSAGSARTIGGANESIVKAAKNKSVFKITADDVVIDGIQITQDGGSGTADAVKASASQSNITFSNNIVANSTDEGIQLEAGNDILISNNYIYNPVGDGITLSSYNVSPVKGSNQKIQNNDIVGSQSAYASIYLYGTKNVEISGNVITTKQGGIAIGSGGLPVSNTWVHHNDINTELRTAYSALAAGIAIDDSGDDITIENNNIVQFGGFSPGGLNDRYNLIRVGVAGGSNPTNVKIHDNYLSRTAAEYYMYVIASVTNEVDATCNWFGTNVAGDVDDRVVATGSIAYTPFLNDGTDDDGGAVGFVPLAGACTCPGSGGIVTNINTGKIYCSIQAAIDDPLTLSGHTISVADGVYPENVKIEKNITLKSLNGSGFTSIEPASGNAITLNGAQYKLADITIEGFFLKTGNSGPSAVNLISWSHVNDGYDNSNLTLRNLVVDGNGQHNWGISVFDIDGLTIENVEIRDTKTGFGFSGVKDVTIDNVNVHNVNEHGLELGSTAGYELNKNITITNSSFTDNGSDGMNIKGVDGLTINNVIFKDNGNNGFTADEGAASQPLNENVKINNSTFIGNGMAIVNEYIGNIDATCNWYGTPHEAEIKSIIQGDVKYFPYKTDPGDSCLEPSFKVKIKKTP